MKVSMAAELAVRGAIVLAQHYGEGPVTLESICNSRNLPKQYLAKIFALLRKAGMVEPVRGKHGGYMLARKPGQITPLDIIEAVEGPVAVNFCQSEPPKCMEYTCRLRPVWKEVQEFIRTKLSSVTLGECVGQSAGD